MRRTKSHDSSTPTMAIEHSNSVKNTVRPSWTNMPPNSERRSSRTWNTA
jgi:hypothetical protein